MSSTYFLKIFLVYNVLYLLIITNTCISRIDFRTLVILSNSFLVLRESGTVFYCAYVCFII